MSFKKKLYFFALFIFIFSFCQNHSAFSLCEEGLPSIATSGSTCTRCTNGSRRGNLTKEPVLLQNGNLVLTDQDVFIPGRGLSLDMTRTYNAQINSKVDGWAPEDGSGSWSIENREYSGDGGETLSQYSYQDAVIEADMKTETPGDYDYEAGSLYFHFQDGFNYYSFVLYKDGTLELGKIEDGWWYLLAQETSTYNPLEWNHIKIITTGGLIEIYVNDHLEITYTDPDPLLSGRTALVSYDSHAHFDNVSIHDNSTIIHSNDFEMNTDGWSPEQGSGPWELELGEYSGQTGRSLSEASSLNTTFTVQMKTIVPGQANDDTAWLNFRYQDADNRYYFYITKDKQLVLGRVQDGVHSILSRAANPAYDPLHGNNIKISAIQDDIRVWINDVLVIQALDYDPLPEGKIALEAKNSHAHFDNVSLRDGSPSLSNDFNSPDIENDTVFGQGWTFTYETKLFEDPNSGLITIRGTDGAKELYTRNSDGSYTSPKGIYSKFTKTFTGYTLREKNGTVHTFDLNGNLIFIKDRNNNQITIYYTLVGGVSRPQTIQDPSGRQITLEYDESGKVKKLTYLAPEKPNFSREIIYIYEGNNLIEADYPSGHKRQYAYDSLTGNLLTYTDLANHTTTYNYSYSDKVFEEIDPDGQKTTFYYSANNTTVRNDRYEYTSYEFGGQDSLLTSVQDTFYENEYNIYDDNHNLIHFEDKLNRATDYEYDAQGNRTKIIKHRDRLLDVVTEFTYEPDFNQATSIKDPAGNTTQFVYDPVHGNLLKTIDPPPLNYETNFVYDEFGNLKTITDARGNITEYQYDPYGNRTKVIEARGMLDYTTIFTYDILSQLTSTIDSNRNPPTAYQYDKAGSLTKTIDGLGHVSEYTYDGSGNRLSETVYHNGQPVTTLYEYDWADNLTRQTNPDGTFMTYTYDLVNFLHLGTANRLTATDANSHTTAYEYDSENRLINVTDPEDHFTEYFYDSVGNLTYMTDANQNSLSYDYDDLNRLNYVYYPDTTLESYTYDDNGNLLTKQKQDGNIIAFTYDALNRLTTKTYPDTSSVIYAYDPLDNLLSVTDPSGAISYDYNEANRLTQVSYPSGHSVGYEYDPVGSRTKLIYPDSRFLNYRYDPLNRLTMIKSQNTTRVAYYQYDDLSRREQLKLANKTLSQYSYDDLNRLTSLTNKTAAGNVLSSFDYTYDFAGNRKAMTTSEGTHNYVYDKINQLTDVTYPTGLPNTINYQFDGVGNREVVTEDTQPTSYTINAMNQYTQVGETDYTYDLNGNLTSDGTNSYAYDYENRLTTVTTPTAAVNYTYDPFGRRIKKEVSTAGQTSEVTNYIYDADQVIMETDGNQVPRYFYVYGQEIDELLLRSSAEASPENFYFHYDGLGSVVNLTKRGGQLVESYTYDVYGNPSQTSPVGNTRMFTGREYESETGLYYFRARMFHPGIGRFLQRDPLVYSDSINFYQYGLNNPINYLDPFGEDTYRINNKFNKSTPTWSPISHSFVAVTDKDPVTGKEKVTKTHSWVNTKGGMWEDPKKDQNREGAQKAIESGVGVWKKGDKSLDKYVEKSFEERKGEKGGFWPGGGTSYRGNCKQQTNKLIKGAQNKKIIDEAQGKKWR